MESYESDERMILLYNKSDYWKDVLALVKAEIENLIPSGHDLILVGNEQLEIKTIGDRCVLPFLEHNGQYWGLPSNDETAILELNRMRKSGAEFIAFAWSGMWWLNHYKTFYSYLRSHFHCSVDDIPLNNAVLVVFDLRDHGILINVRQWSRSKLTRIILECRTKQDHSLKFDEAILALTTEQNPEYLGDYLEFGVYIGTSLACMFQKISELRYDHVRFFGFDSFDGFPECESTINSLYSKEFSCDISFTRKFLTENGIDWRRVYLIKGYFSDTLNESVIERFGIRKASIINIDCMLYSAALQALIFCAPLILDEAIIFFGSWYNDEGTGEKYLGEKRAFTDFLDKYPCFEVEDFGNYSNYGAAFRVNRKT